MAQKDRDLDVIYTEAAAWVVRLHGDDPPAPALRAAFAAWQAQSPACEVAFERELAAWETFDRARALRSAAARPDADFLAPPSAPRPVSRRWATAAAILALAGGMGLADAYFSAPAYATGIGERRTVVLEDGTRVELNTDTRIVVRYHENGREVELSRGEALFDIASDQRPFVVVTKTARLYAASSVINVRLRPKATAVLVKQGAVSLRPLPAMESQSAGISRGSDFTAGTQAEVDGPRVQIASVSTDEVNRVLAWRHDAIDLHGQTLGEAVAEFNRYNRRQLEVSDPSIGRLRLGGYFENHDVDGFVRALGSAFKIRAVKRDDGVVQLMRG
jgi:transmembrane sensor